MTDSLRDQLLGLGFKPAPKPERTPFQKPSTGKHPPRHDSARKPQRQANAVPQRKPQQQANAAPQRKSREEMDLAKAYALRAQREKDERIEAERIKQEEARLRREAKARLAELLQGQALNVPDAEIARHFSYGGKIKRIYVTGPQLRALNAGELGVVQLDGRYLLVAAALLAQAETIFPPSVALKVDPDAAADDDPYADPQYQVPDDLVW